MDNPQSHGGPVQTSLPPDAFPPAASSSELPTPASAGTSSEVLQAEEEAPEPAHETAGLETPHPLKISWKGGVTIKTLDDAFELRIIGIVQADFVSYLNRHDRVDRDSMYLRRARLYVEGRSFRFVEYRLMTEFGREGPTILDGFADLHLIGNALRLRGGKFKQPFSYEQYVMEDRTLIVFERSMIDQLTPARNIGFMVYGESGEVVRWAVSVANGTRDGDTDEPGRDGKDAIGRIDLAPFGRLANPALESMLIGFSASYGRETDKWNPGRIKTPLGVQWFTFDDGVINAGARVRMMPDFYYFVGPFAMGGQYLHQTQKVQKPGYPVGTARFDGGLAMASLVLTGEHRKTYASFVEAKRRFDPSDPIGHPGAWEVVVRGSRLKVGGDAFNPEYALVNQNNWSNRATELSLGLNWYMNPYAWLMLDYEHDWFTRSLPLRGPTQRSRVADEIGVRLTVMW